MKLNIAGILFVFQSKKIKSKSSLFLWITLNRLSGARYIQCKLIITSIDRKDLFMCMKRCMHSFSMDTSFIHLACGVVLTVKKLQYKWCNWNWTLGGAMKQKISPWRNNFNITSTWEAITLKKCRKLQRDHFSSVQCWKKDEVSFLANLSDMGQILNCYVPALYP